MRGARPHRRRAGDVVGGLGRRAAARAHPPPRRRGADGARARARRGARAALRGGRGRRGRLAARGAVRLDAQAGRDPDPRDRARPAVRGLRLRRRHGRLPRPPHLLALVGRRRGGRVRRARRMEPGRRRARRAGDLGAHGLGRRHAPPRGAAAVRPRPLGGRRPALRGRGGARPPRAAARVRLGLRAAVRPLHRLAAARRARSARAGE